MPDLLVPTDLDASLAKAKEYYASEEGGNKGSVSFLICGKVGTGKTKILATAPKPVLIHSFDPGGTKSITSELASGEIIIESFENEEDTSPTEYLRWGKHFDSLRRSGFFKQLAEKGGTFCVDSATLWGEAALNVYSRGRKASPLNYMEQQLLIRDATKAIVNLPCHTILTAHIEPVRDEDDGKIMGHDIIMTGKNRTKVPMLFDEIYVMDVNETRQGKEYRVLTSSKSKYTARTRIGAGILNEYEPANISEILKKCGY